VPVDIYITGIVLIEGSLKRLVWTVSCKRGFCGVKLKADEVGKKSREMSSS
jgi:hypothetical protein